MSVITPAPVTVPVAGSRTLHVGGRRVPVVLPRRSDPRLHLSLVTVSLFVIGIGWLDFRLSVAQIAAAAATAVLIEMPIAYRRTKAIVWPASGDSKVCRYHAARSIAAR